MTLAGRYAKRAGLDQDRRACDRISFLEAAIDSNPAERAPHPIGIGRRILFSAGADAGAATPARAMAIVATVRPDRLDELLPWNWSGGPQ